MITHTFLDSLTWSLYEFGGVLMGLALKLFSTMCLLQFVYLSFSTQFLNCQEAVKAGVPFILGLLALGRQGWEDWDLTNEFKTNLGYGRPHLKKASVLLKGLQVWQGIPVIPASGETKQRIFRV